MDFGLQKILSNLDLINNSIKNTVYNNRLIEKAIISAKYIHYPYSKHPYIIKLKFYDGGFIMITPATLNYIYSKKVDLDNEYYLNTLKSARKDILESRKITTLLHFTKYNFLEKILQDGILSKTLLEKQNEYINASGARCDDMENFINTSITFPNFKLLYKNMCSTPDKWVILRIKSDILLDKIDSEFYKHNASRTVSKSKSILPYTNEALESMFYRGNLTELPDNFPTDPEAEVLINRIIEPKYIVGIDCQEEDDKIKSICTNNHIEYNPESKLYLTRENYLYETNQIKKYTLK